jgi:hypothetical protein
VRIHTVLPVWVTWSEQGKTRKEFACTLDVSRKGARLANVKGLGGPGQIVALRRKSSEAPFRVVWIGPPQTQCEGQIGVECIDPDKTFWDIDFADAHEDFEPIDTVSSGNLASQASQPLKTKSPNYPCSGTARVWASESALECTEAGLTAIGSFGAELCGDGLPLDEIALLQLQIGETILTVKAVISVGDGTSRRFVEFSQIRRGDRRALQHLVAQLSTPKPRPL